jgi:hypothetical protein
MRHLVTVVVSCSEADGVAVYKKLISFDELAAHTSVVRSVVQDHDSGVSHWDVNFRSGRLCWTESDVFDEDRLEVRFEAIAGDPQEFQGRWQVTPVGEGCSVTFEATLELGIGSFEGVLDPIAAQTVIENMVTILTALLPDVIVERQDIAKLPSPAGESVRG